MFVKSKHRKIKSKIQKGKEQNTEDKKAKHRQVKSKTQEDKSKTQKGKKQNTER